MEIKNVKEFVDILKKGNDVVFITEDSSIQFNSDSDINGLNIRLQALGLSTELVQKKVRIATYQNGLTIFLDVNDFEFRVKEQDFKSPILIINLEGHSYYYFNNVMLEDFESVTHNFLVSNAQAYFKLLRFLSDQEHKEDTVFYFVDHFNWDNRTIVFTSLKREGKLSIVFPNSLFHIDPRYNLNKRVLRLIGAFEPQNKHLPKFIKAELFNFLSKEEKKSRISVLVTKLDEILDAAEQNHEIYLSDLSLEELKREYFEHKDTYFLQIREILGKVTNQIISLPLSITASAFATYKVTDSLLTQIMILSVFVVYSVYMIFIIKLHRQDLLEIEVQSKEDFKKIEKSSFFVQYPSEILDFQKVKDRISNKIKTMSAVIIVYYFTLLGTNTLFIVFVLLQVGVSGVCSSIAGACFTAIAVLFWFIPKPSSI